LSKPNNEPPAQECLSKSKSEGDRRKGGTRAHVEVAPRRECLDKGGDDDEDGTSSDSGASAKVVGKRRGEEEPGDDVACGPRRGRGEEIARSTGWSPCGSLGG
jgi:hypothetical protein